jgi:hypothetical protein
MAARISLYCIDFTVVGNGPFPLDMLRYDSCFPVDDEAVASIGMGVGEDDYHFVNRRVRLRLYSQHNIGPTVGRWNSFLWKVEQ